MRKYTKKSYVNFVGELMKTYRNGFLYPALLILMTLLKVSNVTIQKIPKKKKKKNNNNMA